MKVSVVIPVYNAEAFVRQAAESALMQPETGEVILIEDGSSDDSLRVCRELAQEHPRVVFLQHEDGGNHGAGASRNLGVQNARFPYIAFLDGDDQFEPGRFSLARRLFEADLTVEGVYEAVGIHFETQEAQDRWGAVHRETLTTMKAAIPPDALFEAQEPIGNQGFYHIDGWTVNQTVFTKAGLFDDHLRLHQDTAMFVKSAAVCRMVPGQLDAPVAMRRIHDHNRITAPRSPTEAYRDRRLMWGTLWRWGKRNLPRARRELVMDRFLSCGPSLFGVHSHSGARRIAAFLKRMVGLVLRYPDLFLDKLFWIWQVRKFRSIWSREASHLARHRQV